MEIKFVNVQYKNIFKNLNLKISSNQITTIIGKNGIGKTSLLNLIFASDLDISGKIVVYKNNIIENENEEQLSEFRKDIFYLTQDYHNQFFNIKIEDDIKYTIPKLDYNKLDELLKSFSLNKEMLNKNYSELSDSDLKKILIIMMSLSNKKIILLDDPTSNLDQKSISTLIKILKKEKRNDKIILIASQDLEFLFNVSDKIIMLDNNGAVEKNNKYEFFSSLTLLNKCNLVIPSVLQFREVVYNTKGIKLVYRDNINDLIKDIYRSAK